MLYKCDPNINHLRDFVKDSYFTKKFSDVTIVSDDQMNVRAHKGTLCFFSDVLKNILQPMHDFTYDTRTVIFLKGIKHHEIEAILSFIYLGEFEIEDTQIPELLAAAKSLEISQLRSVLEKIQEENHKNETKITEILDKSSPNLLQDEWDETKESIANILPQHSESEVIIPTIGFGFGIEDLEKTKTVLIQEVHNCSDCFKVFSSRKSLHRHMKNQHKDSIYFKQFAVKSELVELDIKPPRVALDSSERSKRWRDRNPIQKVDCPEFGKTISNRTLRHHMQLAHSIKDKTCTECGKCFGTQKSLELHMKLTHDNKECVCDQCDYRSATNGGLRLHIESKHEGIKHPCTFENCDAIYLSKGTLTNHVRTDHEGLRYECDKCEFKAKFSTNLTDHKRSIHEDAYNYNCTECDMKFKARPTLKQHVQGIHQKICYQCPVCEKLLTQFGDLKRHSKKIHKIEIPPNQGKKYVFP